MRSIAAEIGNMAVRLMKTNLGYTYWLNGMDVLIDLIMSMIREGKCRLYTVGVVVWAPEAPTC